MTWSILRRVTALFALLTAAACANTGGDSPRAAEPTAEPAKGGDVAPPTMAVAKPGTQEPGASTVGGGAPKQDGLPSTEQQLAFVNLATEPGTAFGEPERDLVARLPAVPPSGSVTEAALALGLVRTVLNPPLPPAPKFEERDIGKAPASGPPKPSTALSLEQLCKERRLNLADAVANNRLLANPGFAKQLVAALDKTEAENSAAFTTNLRAVLQQQAAQWQAAAGQGAQAPTNAPAIMPLLPPTLIPAGPGGSAAAGTAAAGTAAAAPATPAPAAPLLSLADLSNGDAILATAQALADKGKYQEAIKTAAMLPDDSPLKAQAKQKSKDFSNMAVQDLRRRAAAAFQSAMPLSDPRTRSVYLNQAKTLLEEAVRDYPDATQLPTVRENLNVITRDLERLQPPGGERKGA